MRRDSPRSVRLHRNQLSESGEQYKRKRPDPRRRWFSPLEPEEQDGLDGQIRELIGLSRQRPMDLPAHFAIGQACLRADETGYWWRVEEYRVHRGFPDFAAHVTGEGSRQTYDRRMLLAGVFSAETIARCHGHGVGFRVLTTIATAEWRWRPVLVGLACEKIPLRALLHLRLVAESHDGAQEDLPGVLREAYAEWQAGARAQHDGDSDPAERIEAQTLRRWRVSLERREQLLSARELAERDSPGYGEPVGYGNE